MSLAGSRFERIWRHLDFYSTTKFAVRYSVLFPVASLA